jgi:hypothetical protein
MNINAQRGQSMWGNLFMIGMLIFAAITVMKLWEPYYNDFAVAKAVENMKSDNTVPGMNAEEMRASLNKRLQISGVSLTKENVKITKDDDAIQMDIAYEKRIPMYGNIDAVVMFKHSLHVESK